MSQYCAFSLIILCPWWEYISTEEQLIDKSADVHVVYVSKTQDLLNGPISDGCPFIQDQYGRVLYILHSPPGSEGFGVDQFRSNVPLQVTPLAARSLPNYILKNHSKTHLGKKRAKIFIVCVHCEVSLRNRVYLLSGGSVSSWFRNLGIGKIVSVECCL